VDPSDNIIESLILANKWNLLSRQKDLPVDKLPEVERLGKEFMESLKQVFPERTGATNAEGDLKGWCFEKFHSIRHTARSILLFGNLEGTSAQGPERCHIDFVKQPALLSNRKQMLECIMNYHSRMMKLRAMKKLSDYAKAKGPQEAAADFVEVEISQDMDVQMDISALVAEQAGEKQHFFPCEIGMRYPYKQAGENKEVLHTRAKVMYLFHVLDYKFTPACILS
jgi:hypothetical protein